MIDKASDVQIWESVTGDTEGDPTWDLLRAAVYLKDNRIPPRGFTTRSQHYEHTAIHGAAATDGDFNRDGEREGTGADVVTYRVALGGRRGKLAVRVDLLYQACPPDFMANLLAAETSASRRLAKYEKDARKTPETVRSKIIVVDVE